MMTNKVLIAEDSPTTMMAIRTMLKLNGFEVVGEASDGNEAVKIYTKTKPDVVLMDLAMPKMHGLDALKAILRTDPDAKIIVITAIYSEEKKNAALEAGALKVVDKPFSVPEILSAISDALVHTLKTQ